MTKYDFIFSDQRRHRIARHFAFWFVWCLAYNLLFHFPIHVFKGWDTSGPGTKNLQVLGPTLFFIKTLIVNSFFGVIVPQILLTYILIYWLLPKYFLKKRNPLFVIGITATILLIFYFLAVLFKFSPGIYNKIAGVDRTLRAFYAYDKIVIIDQFSSLPLIIGLALMIKLVKGWWQKQKENELLAKEKTKAELQLLKAQVHPHFLFNTLNNIYFFTLTNSTQAPEMIKKLSGMLQYILNECNLPLVYLEKEIEMIRDYMALEKIRYPEHMEMTIEIEDGLNNKMIAPLLLIPFVENSFKHGASKMITQPWINLKIHIENNWLNFIIINSKPPNNEIAISQACPVNLPDRQACRQGNIGLINVTKRLELLYPGTHVLNIVSEPGSYAVYLKLQLQDVKDHTMAEDELNNLNEYAMA